jgi:hypothetical protein
MITEASAFWSSPAATWAGLAVATLLTLCIYSMLYRDNPFFKTAEHLFVGLSAAYGFIYAWRDLIRPQLLDALFRRCWMPGHPVADPAQPPAYAARTRDWISLDLIKPLEPSENLWLLIPLVLSLFILLRFHPKLSWLSRWSFAFIVGYSSGTVIPFSISATIFKQMQPMLEAPGGSWDVQVRNLLILAGVVSVLVYFFFSVEHVGLVKHVSKVGTFFLMIAFGASFGNTVTAREALLIKRLQILFPEDLGTPDGRLRFIFTLGGIALLAAGLVLWRRRARDERPA